MNERRRQLLGSWRRVSAVQYAGSDGVRQYIVKRFASEAARPWVVLVDGVQLGSVLGGVSRKGFAPLGAVGARPRTFIGCEAACSAAEEHAERADVAASTATASPRQLSFFEGEKDVAPAPDEAGRGRGPKP